MGKRKSGEINVYTGSVPITNNGSGWVIIDGRGKSCAGVLAALTRQTEADRRSFVEAILADALNIYDVTVWAEKSGHQVLTQRSESDRTVQVLIQPRALN